MSDNGRRELACRIYSDQCLKRAEIWEGFGRVCGAEAPTVSINVPGEEGTCNRCRGREGVSGVGVNVLEAPGGEAR